MLSNEHQDAGALSDVVKLRARAALLFALLSHARQQLATFEDELQRRDSTISQLDARLRQQEALLQQQEETVAVIMQSMSWRLTAPLRALKRAARRSR
jgi:hypothetical protein